MGEFGEVQANIRTTRRGSAAEDFLACVNSTNR